MATGTDQSARSSSATVAEIEPEWTPAGYRGSTAAARQLDAAANRRVKVVTGSRPEIFYAYFWVDLDEGPDRGSIYLTGVSVRQPLTGDGAVSPRSLRRFPYDRYIATALAALRQHELNAALERAEI